MIDSSGIFGGLLSLCSNVQEGEGRNAGKPGKPMDTEHVLGKGKALSGKTLERGERRDED